VTVDEIVNGYAWLLFLIAAWALLWPSSELGQRRANDAAFAAADRAIRRKLLFWTSIPWVVMGLAQLAGGIQLWRFFEPRYGGPWVSAFFASVLALWIALAYWIFLGSGASVVVKHQLVIAHGFRGRIDLTPKRVKLVAGVLLAGGVSVVVLMYSPLWPWAVYVRQQSLEWTVNVGSVAAGAGKQCAPAAPLGRFWAAPQLHR
jgi:hypothetical protein